MQGLIRPEPAEPARRLCLASTSLAGFTFAKFDFPGQKWLFILLLATIVVPSQLGAVPLFVIMANLGWVGSLKALIVPGIAGASKG